MHYSLYIPLCALSFLSFTTAAPRLPFSGPSWTKSDKRDIPSVPARPEGVPQNSFHGSQFQFFDDIGFVRGSPAVEAAPVFLFSRTESHTDPCYPESAVVLGSDPPRKNPGTGDPDQGIASYNPGADCTNPGPYHGAYSLGNPFPVYASASYCGQQGVWKLTYNTYYVHDGNLLAGHRNDWEGVTIVFGKDPAAPNDDWWYRAGATYNRHGSHDVFKWKDLITVAVDVAEGDSDISNDKPGRNMNHPKVYVGFFSHSAYREEDDSLSVNAGAHATTEYRSDDWWRLPRAEDMHSWKEIPKEWNYGHADSTPYENQKNACGWDLKGLFD